jgi:hypothetical protein
MNPPEKVALPTDQEAHDSYEECLPNWGNARGSITSSEFLTKYLQSL